MPRGGILITCNFVAAKRAQKKATKGLKCVGGAGVSTKKDAPSIERFNFNGLLWPWDRRLSKKDMLNVWILFASSLCSVSFFRARLWKLKQ